MPAQVDDFNYDIWLEHSSAKVGYRLARDEDGNVQMSTGSAPFASSQIFSGSFSQDNVNVNVNSPVAFQDWSGGAGFYEADLEDPVGKLVYYRGAEIDTSWPGVAYISPELNSGSSTTQAAIKFVYSTLGLFVMTARYVLEWTGAAWTSRVDTGGTNTNTDLIEFSNSTGTYLVLGVSGGNYYISSDGITWSTVGTAPSSGPTFRADAEASGTGTSAVVTKPTGTADNDILVAIVSNRVGSDVSAPAGWTHLVSQKATAVNIHYTCVYWKRASSEGADYTFTWASSGLYRATVSAYSGAITTGSPFEDTDYTSNVNTTTTHTLPAMTSAGANRLAIGMTSAMDDANSSISFTVPAGYTETQDSAGVIGHEGSYIAVAAAGAVASAAATSSTAGYGLSFHALLIPSISGGGGTATFLDISRFAIRGQSNGDPLLWAIDSTGDIRNTADPTDGSAWSAADSVRMGTGSRIAGLEVIDNVFYLFHSRGITSYDGTTVSTVWSNSSLSLESTAARPYTWVDKAVYFTFSGTLFRYTADQLSIEKVWPRSGQTGSSDLNGTITAITGDAANLWFVIKNTAGTSYIMKCNPYTQLTYKNDTFMPVHPLVTAGSTTVGSILIVPGASDTLSTTNPQAVYGNTTLASYFLLPIYNKEPKDDSNYRFTTAGGSLYGSWVRGAGKTFNKFLNRVTSVGITMSATSYIATYYSKDYNEATQLVQTATTDGLSSTGLSSDVEFANIRYVILMDTASTSTSPRLNAVNFDISLNPNRLRQWELQIEISDNQEMLGGGDSSYSARYLATHLFNGLTERVTLYDRLGNSFICKILDVTSVNVGEDKEVYRVPLVQLV